jgi:hypothetical protein
MRQLLSLGTPYSGSAVATLIADGVGPAAGSCGPLLQGIAALSPLTPYRSTQGIRDLRPEAPIISQTIANSMAQWASRVSAYAGDISVSSARAVTDAWWIPMRWGSCALHALVPTEGNDGVVPISSALAPAQGQPPLTKFAPYVGIDHIGLTGTQTGGQAQDVVTRLKHVLCDSSPNEMCPVALTGSSFSISCLNCFPIEGTSLSSNLLYSVTFNGVTQPGGHVHLVTHYGTFVGVIDIPITGGQTGTFQFTDGLWFGGDDNPLTFQTKIITYVPPSGVSSTATLIVPRGPMF